MDFAPTDDQELFRATARSFLEREAPLATVRSWIDRPDGFDAGWWRQAAEIGFTSFLVSEEAGGGSLSGRGLDDLLIVAEEMGRLVSPGPLVPANVVAGAVSTSATRQQRERLLPGILSGDHVPGWCSGVEVEVVVDGDDHHFVLRGGASLVEAGAQAQEVLVTATGSAGLTQFLVPVDAPGVTVTPLVGIDLVRRFARLDFGDVRVDRSSVLGQVGRAGPALQHQRLVALVLQCSETTGAMSRVLEFTLDYLGDRYAAGRPLSSYQVLKHYLADMKLWLEASRGVTALAARAVHDQTDEAEELVRAAAAYVGEHGTELVQKAVQLHGGIGITWEHDLHLYLRRVSLNRNLGGTPAEHLERLAELSLQQLETS
ncbi:MAG TPA: acyl-CoA dehydrogenase family protein [Acidimicrobiales bacterium]